MYLLGDIVTNRTEYIALTLSALSTKRMYDEVKGNVCTEVKKMKRLAEDTEEVQEKVMAGGCSGYVSRISI